MRGVQEVLVDGGELAREDLVEEVDDLRIGLHSGRLLLARSCVHLESSTVGTRVQEQDVKAILRVGIKSDVSVREHGRRTTRQRTRIRRRRDPPASSASSSRERANVVALDTAPRAPQPRLSARLVYCMTWNASRRARTMAGAMHRNAAATRGAHRTCTRVEVDKCGFERLAGAGSVARRALRAAPAIGRKVEGDRTSTPIAADAMRAVRAKRDAVAPIAELESGPRRGELTHRGIGIHADRCRERTRPWEDESRSAGRSLADEKPRRRLEQWLGQRAREHWVDPRASRRLRARAPSVRPMRIRRRRRCPRRCIAKHMRSVDLSSDDRERRRQPPARKGRTPDEATPPAIMSEP